MATQFLIIDGYNLMHDAGLARATYGPGQLARQRLELLRKLARRMTIEQRQRCTIVFDAIDAPPNLTSRFKHEGMLILFARPGQEADEVIEELILKHSAPRQLMVVSSDHRLQTSIRKRRGIAIDSDVYLRQLGSPDRQIGPTQHSVAPAESDLGFWMQEFAGINPEEINSQVDAQSGEKRSDWDREIDQLQQRIRNPEDLDEWLNESPRSSPQNRGKSSGK